KARGTAHQQIGKIFSCAPLGDDALRMICTFAWNEAELYLRVGFLKDRPDLLIGRVMRTIDRYLALFLSNFDGSFPLPLPIGLGICRNRNKLGKKDENSDEQDRLRHRGFSHHSITPIAIVLPMPAPFPRRERPCT